MLSIKHPSILLALRRCRYGLMPVFVGSEGIGVLVLKVSKEAILAARLKNEVKVYLLPSEEAVASHLGVVTAFFDEIDEPPTITTPLCSGDGLLPDLVSILSEPEFDLYFFDEQDREWIGVRAINPDVERCQNEFATATFTPFNIATYPALASRLDDRFADRGGTDDRSAFTLILGARLYPRDFMMFDFRLEAYQFREAKSRPAVVQLIREKPGLPHERDIAVMFSRAFAAGSIYLNPTRTDTGKGLTDVMVVTDRVILFVEAKDSPNTSTSFERTLRRKRQSVQNHIEKATKQLRAGLDMRSVKVL